MVEKILSVVLPEWAQRSSEVRRPDDFNAEPPPGRVERGDRDDVRRR